MISTLTAAGCLEDPDRPALSGIVAADGTTEVALGWFPPDVLGLMTLGESVAIGDDRTFDPTALLPSAEADVAAFTCSEGPSPEEFGLSCAAAPPEDTGVRIGLARILGFAERPTTDPMPIRPFESSAVCDDVAAVWTSAPIERGSREWYAFQTELPQGASLVRRVHCATITDPCLLCWPFLEAPHCLQPVGAEDLLVVRSWQGRGGEPRP